MFYVKYNFLGNTNCESPTYLFAIKIKSEVTN